MSPLPTFDAKEIELLGQIISSGLKTDLSEITNELKILNSKIADIETKATITQEQLNSFHTSISNAIAEIKKDIRDIENKHDNHVSDLYDRLSNVESAIRVDMERAYVKKETCTTVEQHVLVSLEKSIDAKTNGLRKDIEAGFERKMRYTQFLIFIATTVAAVVIYLVKNTK